MERESMQGAWEEPDYGTIYLLYDEGEEPYALGTYLDLVIFASQKDPELWPHNQFDVDSLLWSFDAWETGRTVGELTVDSRRRGE